MKPIISFILILFSLQVFAKQESSKLFVDNYWRGFHYYYQKKFNLNLNQITTHNNHVVLLYGGETSLLQRKLLFHEIGVPQFFKPGSEDADISQYLKWIIFSKQDPRKIFPDIIRRPLGYVPNFLTESFYRFGISVPL